MKIRKNRHDWGYIGRDKNYEYSQCQHPSCGKCMKNPHGAGKPKIIPFKSIPKDALK